MDGAGDVNGICGRDLRPGICGRGAPTPVVAGVAGRVWRIRCVRHSAFAGESRGGDGFGRGQRDFDFFEDCFFALAGDFAAEPSESGMSSVMPILMMLLADSPFALRMSLTETP